MQNLCVPSYPGTNVLIDDNISYLFTITLDVVVSEVVVVKLEGT